MACPVRCHESGVPGNMTLTAPWRFFVRSASCDRNCRFADHSLGVPAFVAGKHVFHRRLRRTSDGNHRDLAARSFDKPPYVIRVACENHRFLANRCRHHNGVNDICSSGFAQ
jgi:hypothetical protein